VATCAMLKAKRGDIRLVMGPMASGKTLELLAMVDAERSHTPAVDDEVMFVGSSMNTRDGGFIASRAFGGGKVSVPLTVSVTRLLDVVSHPAFKAARVLCVDELHMYPGAAADILALSTRHSKVVIAAGLFTDKLNVPFEGIPSCLAVATTIRFKQARCVECSAWCGATRARVKTTGLPVTSSKDVEATGGTLVVDDTTSPLEYEPCCIEHHWAVSTPTRDDEE